MPAFLNQVNKSNKIKKNIERSPRLIRPIKGIERSPRLIRPIKGIERYARLTRPNKRY